MHIGLVGGIFDKQDAHRASHAVTPETVLMGGLTNRGIAVEALGHSDLDDSHQFDLVHVHHFGRAAVMLASKRERPVFIFTGHNGKIPTGWESSVMRRVLYRYVVRQADAFVALSEAEADYYSQFIDRSRIAVIPNGIPADIYGQELFEPRDADEDFVNLLYVGQLIDWKGVDILFEAICLVRLDLPVRLRLVFHNADLLEELQQLASELRISDHVDFVGSLNPSELSDEYKKADLLVLPSYADCLPSVITESFLCGTPVVAGAVCGVPEQVGDYGVAVTPGDPRLLAAAIEQVGSRRSEFRLRSAEIRDYAVVKFHPDRMVEQHIELYERLLATQVLGHDGIVNRLVRRFVRLIARVRW